MGIVKKAYRRQRRKLIRTGRQETPPSGGRFRIREIPPEGQWHKAKAKFRDRI
jgi:hypothetical protein